MNFVKELDDVVQEIYKDIIVSLNPKILAFQFKIDVDDNFLEKYKLTNDLVFICSVSTSETKMDYYYKGPEIKPQTHYIRPEDYSEVGLITTLQECINQDTNTPDIKKLESKKES